MGKALLVLSSQAIRDKAKHWIDIAPANTRVTYNGPKRTLPQNDRLHALVTDIASQKLYNGLRLDVTEWKLVFMDALNDELGLKVRLVPNLSNTGFVNLGNSTSALEVAHCSDLIEIITAWGVQNGVVFSDPKFADMAERIGEPA